MSLLRRPSILTLLILLFSNGYAQMRQVYKENSNPDNEIYKISFYSPSQGYVAFRDWIGFTADSGRTFAKKYITLSNVDFNGYGVNLTFGFGINGVKAFSQDTLLAYGDYGLVPAILYSTNGGNNFKLIYHSQFDPLQLRTGITDVVFPQNGSTGYAVDADRILKTTNRGVSWTANLVSSGSYFDYLEAVDNNNVFAFSTTYNSNKLLKTTTGGTAWQQLSLPSGQLLSYAHFLTAGKGWINTRNSTDGGRTYYTANGGSSWTLKNNPAAVPFSTGKMRFVNDSTGYALAGLFGVYKTTDSGKIWQRLPRDNGFTYLGYSFNDLHLWSGAQLWAGGGYGFLEISTNGGGTPLPAAYFRIDTTGVLATGTVNLVNYSKPGYQYQWFVNNVPAGNGYHASYTHDIYSTKDSVKLIVSDGSNADTLLKYQYFYPPVIVSSFTPATGGGGTVVQIRGRNFTGATGVTFGGSPASFTVLSDTAVTATVGIGASGSVKVVTPTGSGSLAGFTFIPPPVISSFAPSSAAAGASVTITGQNFTSVTAVNFGGVPAASFTVITPTTITAVVGAGATGNLSVTAIGGTANVAGFVALPNVVSFTPASGTFGTYMTITGTGFTGTTGVKVGGTPVASFTVNSHTGITAVLANGTTGDVTVTTPGGSSSLSAFKYNLPPVITSFSPLSGPLGTQVTITGANFDPVPAGNTVYFGGVKAAVTGGTATSLTVTVPAGATFAPVNVTANNLTAYSQQPFVVSFANGGAITAASFNSTITLGLASDEYLEEAAIGDVDGDGKPDIAVIKKATYVNQSALAVYRNTSTGSTVSFAPKVEFAVAYPGGIALSDVDGDGKLDAAVTDDDGYKIYLFRNTSAPGSVSFAPRFEFTTAQMKQKIALEDLDGDGKPDLVASTWWESKLVVHRNVSNPGAFAFGPRIDIAGAATRNVVIRDVDGDGKPELIDANRILKNNSTKGTISFGPPLTYSTYVHSHVAVGDVDGDGKTDIVTSDPYGSKAAVYRNTTTTALSLAPAVLIDAVSSPAGIALNDFDGDGKIDIATPLANFSMGVLKNTSSPGTVSFAPNVGYLPGTYQVDKTIASGDLNGDGKPETIIAAQVLINTVKPEPFIASFTPAIGQAGTSVTITGANFTGATAVSFGGVPAASFTVNTPASITATVGNGAAGNVTVTTAAGTGTRAGFVYGFPPAITNLTPQAAPEGSTITLTGNNFSAAAGGNTVYFGSVKAAVLTATATTLTVKAPKGATFSPVSVTANNLTGYSDKPFITTFPGNGSGFTAASFGDTARFANIGGNGNIMDVDGDGLMDLVLTGNNFIRISRNKSTATAFAFAPTYDLDAGAASAGIGFGDVDGDGRQDLVVSHGSVALVSVFLNNGTPGNVAFAPRMDFSTGLQASGSGPILRDLDGDGKPEIIVSGYNAQTVSVLPNRSTPGNAAFALHIDYTLDGYSTDVKVEDVDGDLLPDLVTTVNGPNEVSVFRNTSIPGSVSFALKEDVAVGAWPLSVAVGDMDGDGRKDLAVANVNGNSVTILRNTGTVGATAFAATTLSVNYRPWAVWLNDMDGDGKPDLGVQKEASNSIFSYARSVSLYKNSSTAGSIALNAPFDYAVGDYTNESLTGDMNGDGKPDMVVFGSIYPAGSSSSSLLIMKNKAGGTATVNLCPNGNAKIASGLSASTYQWQQSTGTGFVNLTNGTNIQGVTTDTLRLLNVPASWNGYQYRCVAGTDTSLVSVLTMNPLPAANAGNDTLICAGSNGAVIGTAAQTGNTYSWSPATGLTSPAAAMPGAAPNATTTYVLTVTNGTGCSAKDTVTVSVMQVPAPAVTLNGPPAFCTGGSVQLTSSAGSGNQWFKDGVSLGGATAQTYTAVQSGIYAVRTTVTGCASSLSTGTNVVAYPVPAVPQVTAGGSTAFCQGGSVSLQSSDTGSHQWYRNGTPIPGATASVYAATQSGAYTAAKTNFACASAPSVAVTVTVNNTVPTPVVSPSAGALCQGDSLLLTSSAAAGNQWYKDGNSVTGAVQSTYSVKQSGAYAVRATVNGCSSNVSSAAVVTVSAVPPAPVVTQNGNVLNSSVSSGNQWFLNGSAIGGATGQTYTATASGEYKSRLAVNGCVGPYSNALALTVTGRIAIGPNPVSGRLLLRSPNSTDRLTVTLFDANGQAVVRSGVFTSGYTIDMRPFRPGTYMVQVINLTTGEREQKVVVKI